MEDKRSNSNQADPEDGIPTFLPLIDFVGDHYSFNKTRPFLDYKILAVQHLLGSSLPFFSMLEKGGAKPQDIYIVGKAYSSHPLVVEQLIQRGYIIAFNDVYDFSVDQPYDSVLEKHIIKSCSKLLNDIGKDQKGLIIDDGGKAIELLHHAFSNYARRFTCVEQTSRGARVVMSLKLSCPVVNVARSNAKTKYESHMIAQAMVNEFLQLLKSWRDLGVFIPGEQKILLLGYGFIGKQVTKQLLNNKFNVSIYDPDELKRLEAQRDGLTIIPSLRNAYPITNIIIGCTGTSIISDNELELLKPGTLLVNMASTDKEFRAWNLRPNGNIIHQNILPTDISYLQDKMPLSWRSLYKVQLRQGPIYLANGGFPCDFSGKINPVPAKDIQLTSALLLCGAIQAISEMKTKFVDLDTKIQKLIIAKYRNLQPH